MHYGYAQRERDHATESLDVSWPDWFSVNPVKLHLKHGRLDENVPPAQIIVNIFQFLSEVFVMLSEAPYLLKIRPGFSGRLRDKGLHTPHMIIMYIYICFCICVCTYVHSSALGCYLSNLLF